MISNDSLNSSWSYNQPNNWNSISQPDLFETFVAHIGMLLDSPRELQQWQGKLEDAKNELLSAIAQKKSESTIDELGNQVKTAVNRVRHYESAVKALEALREYILGSLEREKTL